MTRRLHTLLARPGLRWLLAAALLWPFVSQHVRADWPLIRTGWRRILVLSLLGGATFSSLQFIALQHTTALNASIFNSFAPAIIVAGGALFFKERLGPLNFVGVALSFVGVMVIVSRGDAGTFATFTFNKGDVILLANMGIWAVYSVFLRTRPPIHQMSFTFLLAVISGAASPRRAGSGRSAISGGLYRLPESEEGMTPEEWTAVRLSLLIATTATIFSLPLGIAIAWLLAKPDQFRPAPPPARADRCPGWGA